MNHLISLALLGAGACAVSVMPSLRQHPLRHKFYRRSFAHLGLFNNADRCENSLSAFSAAAEAGYGIELDLQMTADGKIVVFHDDNLRRMCGADVKVEDSTFARLQQFKLGQTEETIPLFSQVLEIVDAKVPLIVEIKSTEKIDRVCLKVYDLLRHYKGDYCIESMNPMIVNWFAKNAPQVMRGQLSTRFHEKPSAAVPAAALSNMMFNFLSKPHFVAYDHKYAADSKAFNFCKSCGAMTVGWTIREGDYHEAVQQYDAIIFEGFLPPVNY